MKEITFDSNFGRFNYSITTTVGDDVNEATTNLCIRGLADTGFRGVSSEVEKALAWNEEKGTGIKGVSKDTKRSEIPFSDEAVEIIGRVGQEKLNDIAKKASLPQMTFKVTGEHAFGENSDAPTKESKELWAKVLEMDFDTQTKALKHLGLDDTTDETAGIVACKKVLQDAKRKAAEAAKNSLGL